jgi:hypothetical protein
MSGDTRFASTHFSMPSAPKQDEQDEQDECVDDDDDDEPEESEVVAVRTPSPLAPELTRLRSSADDHSDEKSESRPTHKYSQTISDFSTHRVPPPPTSPPRQNALYAPSRPAPSTPDGDTEPPPAPSPIPPPPPLRRPPLPRGASAAATARAFGASVLLGKTRHHTSASPPSSPGPTSPISSTISLSSLPTLSLPPSASSYSSSSSSASPHSLPGSRSAPSSPRREASEEFVLPRTDDASVDWADIQTILRHDITCVMLLRYAESVYCAEGVLFWIDATRYRSSPHEHDFLEGLFKMYLDPGATYEINVGHKKKVKLLSLRARFHELSEEEKEKMFDEALYEVEQLLQQNALDGFRKCTEWRQFLITHDARVRILRQLRAGTADEEATRAWPSWSSADLQFYDENDCGFMLAYQRQRELEKNCPLEVLEEGVLQKRARSNRHLWQRRYFRLVRHRTTDHHQLLYFKSQSEAEKDMADNTSVRLCGVIACNEITSLTVAKAGVGAHGGRRFALNLGEQEFQLLAETPSDLFRWTMALSQFCIKPDKKHLPRVLRRGPLKKRAEWNRHLWQYRCFQLVSSAAGNDARLVFYNKEADVGIRRYNGVILLSSLVAVVRRTRGVGSATRSRFALEFADRQPMELVAVNSSDCIEWTEVISKFMPAPQSSALKELVNIYERV